MSMQLLSLIRTHFQSKTRTNVFFENLWGSYVFSRSFHFLAPDSEKRQTCDLNLKKYDDSKRNSESTAPFTIIFYARRQKNFAISNETQTHTIFREFTRSLTVLIHHHHFSLFHSSNFHETKFFMERINLKNMNK